MKLIEIDEKRIRKRKKEKVSDHYKKSKAQIEENKTNSRK